MIRVKQLEALKPGEWLSDDNTRGGGRFTARKMVGGAVAFYFRYTLPSGNRDLLKIGEWSEHGDGIYLMTLEQARFKAILLRERYLAGERDLKGAIQQQKEREQHELAAEKKRAAHEEELQHRRMELNLGGLLTAYVGLLYSNGKTSALSVEKALHRHIKDSFPEIWGLPIDDADEDAMSPLLDRLTEAGKLREAAKLRSYLRAAFSAAVKSRKAGGVIPLRRFNVRTNPLRDMPTIDGANGCRERALTVSELRAYWRRISELPEPYGALLRFHLLTGCQRILQLGRLTVADLDGEAVIISDPKGRRDKPRRHLVPLLSDANEALEVMGSPRLGNYLVSVTLGETAAGYDVIGGWVRKVGEEMIEAGETATVFTPGDLRRTVETRLAALGVSRETRAQLQSHGLSGVQQRHYNVHDYASEKKEALERLYRLVTSREAEKVTPIRRGS